MNYIKNETKRLSSENLPVFFTGLSETVKKEPKIPLLCILCGSSLANKAKNNNNSPEKTNSYNGCENCAKNFENIKAALELLSKISTNPPTITSQLSPPELKDNNTNVNRNKRKTLLPRPVNQSPRPNGMLSRPHEDKTSEYSNRQDSYPVNQPVPDGMYINPYMDKSPEYNNTQQGSYPSNQSTPNGMISNPHMDRSPDYNNTQDSYPVNQPTSNGMFLNSPMDISPEYSNRQGSYQVNQLIPNGMNVNSPMDVSPEYNNNNRQVSHSDNRSTPKSRRSYPRMNESSEYNVQDACIVQNDKSPNLKRKSSFQLNTPKRIKNPSPAGGNSYQKVRNSAYENLGNSIWELYRKHKQTQDVYNKKMTLRDKLHEMLLTAFPTCGLYVVGSSMTGLGAKSSDMDMCLMLTHDEIDQEREAKNILHTVRDVFLNCNFLQNVEVIYAKVPILRFTDCVSGIEVDLNVNNAVGIRNTQLLSSYARIDERFPPLVLLVKLWARHHGINDAKNNSLSSYSLVLMVIHFLQYGCQPPVLPCLQQLQPEKYRPNSDVRQLKLKEDLPDFCSENAMNVGDLFIGFLNYFSHQFDYFRSVMSIRSGGIIPKEVAMNNTYSAKNKRAHWKWVCIEEPFELTNTACAVFKPDVFHYIRQVFSNCCATIKRTANLNSILQ